MSASASDPLQVCLTFDFDAMSVWAQTAGQTTPTPLSRGEFGARVAMPRIMRVLERERVPATFFTPGHTIDTYPELCASILESGHEIAHHGYFHESPVDLDEHEERAVLDNGLAAMERNLDGYRPQGYRSPAWDLSERSTALLREYGFLYDSSMMAQDFEPYWARTGDECPRDRAYVFGAEIELVELPVSWSLDDFPQLELVVAPPVIFPAANNPSQLLQRWLEDLEFAALEVPGGVFNVTFHPQTIGRGARLRILERVIARAKDLKAEFVTCAEAAGAWAANRGRSRSSSSESERTAV